MMAVPVNSTDRKLINQMKKNRLLNPYHGVDLRFAPFCKINYIDAVVIQVLNASMEIFLQKGSWLSWDRDPSKTELWERTKTTLSYDKHVGERNEHSTWSMGSESDWAKGGCHVGKWTELYYVLAGPAQGNGNDLGAEEQDL